MATTVMATYRVQSGKESEFEALLVRHWPTLSELGLVSEDPAQLYKGGEEGAPVYYELFSWRSAEAVGVAHETPEVMAIWEPMGALVEEREGRPGMEFPHMAPLTLG